MPARDRPAGDGHEEHRPEGLERPSDRRLEALVCIDLEGRHVGGDERRQDGADCAHPDRDDRDPEPDVVHRLGEPPDREVRSEIREGEQQDRPQQEARQDPDLAGLRDVGRGVGPLLRLRIGRWDPRIRVRRVNGRVQRARRRAVDRAVDLADDRANRSGRKPRGALRKIGPKRSKRHRRERDAHGEHRHADDADPLPIDEVAGEEAHQPQHQDAERHVGPGCEDRRHDPDEGAGNEHQVEEDEQEHDPPRSRADQARGDGAQRVPVIADGQHDRAVVAGPADEADADHQPQDRREPAPQICRRDDADDRAGRGNRFEVVAVQDEPARGDEVRAVHVHPRGSRPLVVRLDDRAIDALRIERVRGIDHHRADHDDP